MYKNGNQQARIELPVATRHRRDMTGKTVESGVKPEYTHFSDAFPSNSNSLECITSSPKGNDRSPESHQVKSLKYFE